MNASPSWRLPPASAPADLAGAWCAAEVTGNPGWLAALCVAAFLRRCPNKAPTSAGDDGHPSIPSEPVRESVSNPGAADNYGHGSQAVTTDSEEERQPLVVRWTPRRDELLLNMLAMGMPYAQIAADLDLTRSAVAGRVMRLRAKGVRIPGAGIPLNFSKPAKPATRKPYSPALPRANTGGSHEDVAANPKAENVNRAAQPLTKPLTVEPPPSSLIQQHRKNADAIIEFLQKVRAIHGNDFECQVKKISEKTGIDAPSVRSAFAEINRRGQIEIKEPWKAGCGHRVRFLRRREAAE